MEKNQGTNEERKVQIEKKSEPGEKDILKETLKGRDIKVYRKSGEETFKEWRDRQYSVL